MKNEVLGFFKEFHEHSGFVKNLNATFMVLIPKKQIVEDFKDLRPISLVGDLYKILTKVLANRIKRVMDKVISKAQNAFVEGRLSKMEAPIVKDGGSNYQRWRLRIWRLKIVNNLATNLPFFLPC